VPIRIANFPRALLAVATLLSVLVLAGCGYHLAGKGSVLPEHVKAIVIVAFENRTQRPEIEQRVTEEVAQQFSRRGQYQVVTDRAQAQAILEGAITSYLTTPVQFTSQGRATRIEAVVQIEAVMRDLSNDKILWSQGGLLFREQFDVPETSDYFDQETLALDDIAEGAAGALVISILEGF
jgi:outer membrane lipopolysaccharide assembly protein LptE/RlpB